MKKHNEEKDKSLRISFVETVGVANLASHVEFDIEFIMSAWK